MECEYCNHVIGGNYEGVGFPCCEYCGCAVDTNGLACTYEGVSLTGFHSYRVHPKQTCPDCGSSLYRVLNPCEYQLISSTDKR